MKTRTMAGIFLSAGFIFLLIAVRAAAAAEAVKSVATNDLTRLGN